ncbi:hypothetical protein FPHYL_5067 [Fusarium phyllophilum]|uniref:Metallo-beta-lactamase domain-containing protein n=1 Tax=Fusarium phyllophilum TaxID=47803 RepID=A0A8H5JXD0_9HYPO|nr:hypothetical protein FPHYL_5067 [Fusarium phyllophilum]
MESETEPKKPVGSLVDRVCNEAEKAMLTYKQKGLTTVVTYQLPVPCGDCSVHLLIDGGGQTLSAFIMDGGRDAQGLKACDVVLSGLKIITRIHNLRSHFLRAWVVTHWDKDHYEGVLELLQHEKLRNELNEYIRTDNFMLYGVTSKKVSDLAQKALAGSKITATTKLGLGVIGCNFFGDEFNKAGVGFWCVGGDGYSYDTAVDFKIPPTPQVSKDAPRKLQLVCKKTSPTQNERSLMAAIIWPNADQAKQRFSYFCAGDGNVPLERNIICPNVFQGRPVKAFKLDHHGSSGEFSQGDILTLLNLPERLILTPGHQYGHPCWDVLFLIGCMYNEGKSKHGGKLLYTTRLPYWVDASKFEDWCNTDINLSGRISGLFRSGGPLSEEPKFWSGNESKNALVKMFEDFQSKKNPHWKEQLMKPLQEEDDEDEEDDPPYTHQDGLKDFLYNKLYNENAIPDDSLQVRIIEQLVISTKEGTVGKYKMDDGDEMAEEAKIDTEQKTDKDKMDEEVKIVMVKNVGKDKKTDTGSRKAKKKKGKGMGDMDTEDKQTVVQECVSIWNTISEQSIKEGEAQARYYLLQLISANHDELDGAVKSYEWPEQPFQCKL